MEGERKRGDDMRGLLVLKVGGYTYEMRKRAGLNREVRVVRMGLNIYIGMVDGGFLN